jgi:hypothetical protein
MLVAKAFMSILQNQEQPLLVEALELELSSLEDVVALFLRLSS